VEAADMKSELVGAGLKPARLEIGGRILEKAELTRNLPAGWEWKTLGVILEEMNEVLSA
jgi:hypothetical protein